MSTLFVFLSSLIRVYTISILSSLIRVYTICHCQQSDQGLHYLPLSAVWSGSTLFAILSKQYQVYTVCHSQHSDQGLHYLPFSAVWSRSTLFAILSSLIKVKGYTVILRNNLIRVYTIFHSQQSGQGLHYFPFSAVWSELHYLQFSFWSGSTLFAILSSLIRVYTICYSFLAVLSSSTLLAIQCSLIRV